MAQWWPAIKENHSCYFYLYVQLHIFTQHFIPLNIFFRLVKRLYIHYFISQTRHIFTLTFWSLSKTFVRRSLFSSSSGSCHGSDVTWQEPEEELNKLLLTKVSDRDRNVKVKMCQVEIWSSVHINISYQCSWAKISIKHAISIVPFL